MSKDNNKNKTDGDDSPGQQKETINAGKKLQRLRIENGWHIEDISKETKISKSNLRAIETADYSNLPADTFTRGLLTIYSDYLGADTRHIVTQFFQERNDSQQGTKQFRQKKTNQLLSPKTMAEPSHISSATVAGIILVIILAIFITYCFYTSWNPFSSFTNKENPLQAVMKNVLPEKVPDTKTNKTDLTPAKTKISKASPPALEVVMQPASTNSKNKQSRIEKTIVPNLPEQKQKELHFINNYILQAHFTKDTQVESITDEVEVIQRSFKKGAEFQWKAKKSLTLIFNLQDSANLNLNNEKINFPLPENGQLILRIPEAILDQ